MRRARMAPLLVACIAFASGTGHAELFGIFQDGSQNDFLATIGAGGEVVTRGSVLNLGGRLGGVSDADPAAGHFFFVGAQGAASAMSIWSLDVATGDVVDVHVISMTGFSSGPACIRWDAVNERLLAIMTKSSNGDEVLATINPTTGATVAIGTGFPTGGWSSGVCALDASGQRFYFAALSGGNPALYRINASTGALLGSPTITTGLPGVDTNPAFLAWDDAGNRVVGIVGLIPYTAGKVLVTINTTTGALALLGDAIPAGGYSSGVSAFYQAGRALYFLANDVATNTNNTVFGVDANGQLVANAELFSDFVGLTLSSSFLVLVPEPGGAALGIVAFAALALRRALRA